MNPFIKSFRYALKGMLVIFQERSLQIQFIIAVITITAGFYFTITATEWCMVLISIVMVMGLEMINTAIEDLVDLVTSEWKPLAGKIKDVSAGAVLLAAVVAVIVGVLVFYKYFCAEWLK